MESINLEQALKHITDIRRRLAASEYPPAAVQAHQIILGFAAAAAGSLCAAELAGGYVTHAIYRSVASTYLRHQGLETMALAVFTALVVVFCVIRIQAHRAEQSPDLFVDRNLPQLALLAFGSDLLVKLCALAVPILALKPVFVSPLLLVFIADYLLQGRLFVLSLRASLCVAAGTFCLAAYQLTSGDGALLLPLSVFSLLAFVSAWTVKTNAEPRV